MDANHRLSMAYLGDFSHDAAADHALMQAINEQCNDCAAVLQDRADELMREWTGEVAR
jgi:hypothetical protein